MITALLNLQKPASMIIKAFQHMAGHLFSFHNRADHMGGGLAIGKGCPGLCDQFFLIAQNTVHLSQAGPAVRVNLDRTTGGDNSRIGMFTPDSANFLTGLFFCFCRHRAGVHHHHIIETGSLSLIAHNF